MATLYRKYRPQTFAEAVGQNHIKVTLQNEISTGKVAHAYLFCGPRAVGKTTSARLLAKAVNCLDRKAGEFEPCNKCASCEDVMESRSLDIVEMDAASHTGVDNVRENIIASARIAPSKYKYKVFIIDEVHMLSAAAFNSLLKTMEEPPAHVIFILCTTEIHKVPATIISRCERFDFKRISLEDIVKKLAFIIRGEGIKVDKDVLEEIARQSEGHMRDAESLLGQLISIAGKEVTREEADLVIPRSAVGEIIKFLDILVKKDSSGGIALINKLLDDGVDLEKFTEDFIEILRKVMIAKINPILGERLGLDIGESYEIKLNEVKQNLTADQLIVFLEEFMKAQGEMKGSFITQLPLEISVAKLCLGAVRPVPRPSITVSAAARSGQPPISVQPAASASPVLSAADISVENFSPIGNINREAIISRWSEVLAKIKKYNHSLSFVLRVCQPRDVSGSKVCLAFKYKFHKDRIEEGKMKEIVQNVFKEVYGLPLTIEAIIDEAMEVKDEQSSPVLMPEFSAADIGTETGNPGLATNKEPGMGVAGDKITSAPVGGADMMSNLLKAFGGKIVG